LSFCFSCSALLILIHSIHGIIVSEEKSSKHIMIFLEWSEVVPSHIGIQCYTLNGNYEMLSCLGQVSNGGGLQGWGNDTHNDVSTAIKSTIFPCLDFLLNSQVLENKSITEFCPN
jgi:hypothetical protein